MVSFKHFLTLTEDLAGDVTKLTADIAAIDAQINQRVAPLMQRKQALQKLLAQKQQAAGNQQQQQPQPGVAQTTTPT